MENTKYLEMRELVITYKLRPAHIPLPGGGEKVKPDSEVEDTNRIGRAGRVRSLEVSLIV